MRTCTKRTPKPSRRAHTSLIMRLVKTPGSKTQVALTTDPVLEPPRNPTTPPLPANRAGGGQVSSPRQRCKQTRN